MDAIIYPCLILIYILSIYNYRIHVDKLLNNFPWNVLEDLLFLSLWYLPDNDAIYVVLGVIF